MVENGTALYRTETISTLSHADPKYVPNTKLELEIEFLPTGFTVHKGAKIRPDISSVSPKYVPHANVRGHWATVTETKVAHNRLYCGNAYIDLPKSQYYIRGGAAHPGQPRDFVYDYRFPLSISCLRSQSF